MSRVLTHLPKELKSKGKTFVLFTSPFDKSMQETILEIKQAGFKYRIVKVLARNLRGRTDHHGKMYQPNEFLMVEEIS